MLSEQILKLEEYFSPKRLWTRLSKKKILRGKEGRKWYTFYAVSSKYASSIFTVISEFIAFQFFL